MSERIDLRLRTAPGQYGTFAIVGLASANRRTQRSIYGEEPSMVYDSLMPSAVTRGPESPPDSKRNRPGTHRP